MQTVSFVPTYDSDFAKHLASKAEDDTAFAAAEGKKGIQSLAKRSDLYHINPCLVKIQEGWNSRDFSMPENALHIETLARSIASEGVKVPITVAYADGKIVLRDGECRLRAVFYAINNLGAEISVIPCLTERPYQSEADSLVDQAIRNAGKPFSSLELGKHYSRLLNFMPVEEIARRMGQAPASVYNLLKLHSGPEAIKQMVRDSKISSTQALATLNACHGNAEKAVEILQKALDAAASEGRTRATARHLADPTTKGVTVKKMISAILEAADIDEDLDNNQMVIKISIKEWDEIRTALKL